MHVSSSTAPPPLSAQHMLYALHAMLFLMADCPVGTERPDHPSNWKVCAFLEAPSLMACRVFDTRTLSEFAESIACCIDHSWDESQVIPVPYAAT